MKIKCRTPFLLYYITQRNETNHHLQKLRYFPKNLNYITIFSNNKQELSTSDTTISVNVPVVYMSWDVVIFIRQIHYKGIGRGGP